MIAAVLLAGIGAWAVFSRSGGPNGGPEGRVDPKQRATAAPVVSTTVDPPPLPLQRYWFTGDSVASNLASPMAELASARGLAWVSATAIGCRVLEGRPTLPDGTPAGPTTCVPLVQRVAAQELGDAQVAVILSSWEISGLQQGDGYLAFGTPEWETATFDLWTRALDALESAGIRSVVIVSPAPPTDEIAELTPTGLAYAEDVHRYERFLARVAARHAGLVTVVRLSSIVCPGGPCPRIVDGVELRPGDGGHLSSVGAGAVAARLIEVVETAANRLA